MADKDPFKQDLSKIKADDPATSDDTLADQLNKIIGEDGKPKYNDVSTAISALDSSQQYIKTLKSERTTTRAELERLREQVATMETVEDVVNRLSQKQADTIKDQTDPNASQLDEAKIAALIKQTLDSDKQQTIAVSNKTAVLTQLAAKFGEGDALNKAVASRAAELGITPKEVGVMSEQNPKLVLELFKVDTKNIQSVTSSHNVSVNTPRDKEPLKFERSITRGGITNKEMKDMFKASKDETNKRLGIE